VGGVGLGERCGEDGKVGEEETGWEGGAANDEKLLIEEEEDEATDEDDGAAADAPATCSGCENVDSVDDSCGSSVTVLSLLGTISSILSDMMIEACR